MTVEIPKSELLKAGYRIEEDVLVPNQFVLKRPNDAGVPHHPARIGERDGYNYRRFGP